MNLDIIKYTDFTTKESYCKLQEYFGGYDARREYLQIKEPLEDFKITLKIQDEFNINEEYVEKEFFKDFLIPGILKIKDRYFISYKKIMQEKGVLTKEARGEFLKLYRSMIIGYREKIHSNEVDLNIKLIATLQVSLQQLEELINDYSNDPYPDIKEKIQFNWNRTEIEYFFYLLRANKQINWIENKDLGKIIDGAMEYWDGEEYKPINLSRKHLSDFERESLRPVTSANDNLSKIFKDFFHN